MQTVVWIQTHLEEDVEVSLPKQEVYEEYGYTYFKPLLFFIVLLILILNIITEAIAQKMSSNLCLLLTSEKS